MNDLFLVVCGLSAVFFLVFLVQASRPLHKRPKAQPTVRKAPETQVADSISGHRFMAHVETQMAEFLSHQRRTAAMWVAIALIAPLALPLRASAQQAATPPQADAGNQAIPPAIARELDEMKQRIAQLEEELKQRPAGSPSDGAPAADHAVAEAPADTHLPAESALSTPAADTKKKKPDPFSFADFTWLNGNSRIKEVPFDTKFFTPEIRADVDYVYDFHHPQDDTISGSSEIFRSSEFQLTQLGVGGDFHYDNVQVRLMTQFGMYSTDHAAQRCQPGARPVEPGRRLSLCLRGLRRLSH